MSKSFISILGTNNYLECRHTFDGLVSEQPVKYAQEDLIRFFCKYFDEQSEIRIFLTKDAKEKNWLNDGHKDRDNKLIPNKGLEKRLTELNIKAKIKAIDINEGFTEEEIWDNFQKIYETITENEEVIVDITHSFRSLPMLLITLLNYAKQLKKIKVLGIYYAAFESLGTIQEVSKKKPEERTVPILNLTSFSILQDWTNATFDFINNANVNQIQKLIKQSDINSPINDPKTKFFPSAVVRELDNLIYDIALCRGINLIQFNYKDL
ncbi:MAG: TIGR02221 family CRISPR-associated protein, partial [Ignavibacterium sp.]